MKSTVRTLPLLIAGVCLPAGAQPVPVVQTKEFRQSDLRASVAAHRAEQREEVQREQAAAGRRLTAAELVQLREQVRQQSYSAHVPSAESPQAGRGNSAPRPMTAERAHLLPWSQRR